MPKSPPSMNGNFFTKSKLTILGSKKIKFIWIILKQVIVKYKRIEQLLLENAQLFQALANYKNVK